MGSSKKDPAQLFFWGDLMRDHVWEAMSLEERGAYITLLSKAYFRPNPGVVPDDDEYLSKASGGGKRWARLKPKVMAAFKRRPDGSWVQKRMAEEARRRRRMAEQASSRARNAADSRWRKHNKEHPMHAVGTHGTSPQLLAEPSGSGMRKRPRKHKEGNPMHAQAMPSIFSRILESCSSGVPPSERDLKGFDAAAVEDRIRNFMPATKRKLFTFAGWLWKTGDGDMRTVMAVLEEAILKRPSNLFAYFSPGSKARLEAEARAREESRAEDRKAENGNA